MGRGRGRRWVWNNLDEWKPFERRSDRERNGGKRDVKLSARKFNSLGAIGGNS